jgi:hypothetical protein
MVLKIVCYLAQQGYRTHQMVVLTPYPSQLLQLQEALTKDNDPVLNDLDLHDLCHVGLLLPSQAKGVKNPLHLVTVGANTC